MILLSLLLTHNFTFSVEFSLIGLNCTLSFYNCCSLEINALSSSEDFIYSIFVYFTPNPSVFILLNFFLLRAVQLFCEKRISSLNGLPYNITDKKTQKSNCYKILRKILFCILSMELFKNIQ